MTGRDECSVIRAAVLLNPDEPPRHDVRITVENNRIAEISDVPPDERSRIQNVMVLPPLINAHTHLELSDIPTPLRSDSAPSLPSDVDSESNTGFSDWIGLVLRHRNQRTESAASVVMRGLDECRDSGTGYVADICLPHVPYQGELSRSADGMRPQPGVTAFLELIGLTDARVRNAIDLAQEHLAKYTVPSAGGATVTSSAGAEATGTEESGTESTRTEAARSEPAVSPGLSPHAPYTVRRDLLEAATALSRERGIPLSMHLAETPEELQLLDSGTGGIAEMLRSMGLWDDRLFPPGTRAMHYLRQLSQSERCLVIHGNYLQRDEIRFLSESGNLALVVCPRTHSWFGHRNHPWQNVLAAGGRVLIGTDSRASSPDLNMLRELQVLAGGSQVADLIPVLPLATTRAADFLGLPQDHFRVRIDSPFDSSRIHELPSKR